MAAAAARCAKPVGLGDTSDLWDGLPHAATLRWPAAAADTPGGGPVLDGDWWYRLGGCGVGWCPGRSAARAACAAYRRRASGLRRGALRAADRRAAEPLSGRRFGGG